MQELAGDPDDHLRTADALCTPAASHDKRHSQGVVQKSDRCLVRTTNGRTRPWSSREEVRVRAEEVCWGVERVRESHQADVLSQTWKESQEDPGLEVGTNCDPVLRFPEVAVDDGKGSTHTLLAWDNRLPKHTRGVITQIPGRFPLKEEVPIVKSC